MRPADTRDDIPFLRQSDTVYLDSACMSLRPDPVIDAITRYYREFPACSGRSHHSIGERATEAVDNARQQVATFLGATAEDIIFTQNTTHAINLVAHGLGLESDDVVVTSDREHNSNHLPWLESPATHRIVSSTAEERFDMAAFQEALDDVALVSLVHTSNLDGYTLPVEEIIETAHAHGAKVLLDARSVRPTSACGRDESGRRLPRI